MKHALAVLLLASCGAALAQAPAQPDKGKGVLTTRNTTRQPVRVTIYDVKGKQRQVQQTGCVAPGASKKWNVPSAAKAHYLLRGEVTAKANCQQPVRCDAALDFPPGSSASSWSATLKMAGSDACWWELPVKKPPPPGRGGK